MLLLQAAYPSVFNSEQPRDEVSPKAIYSAAAPVHERIARLLHCTPSRKLALLPSNINRAPHVFPVKSSKDKYKNNYGFGRIREPYASLPVQFDAAEKHRIFAAQALFQQGKDITPL